jgi:enamine deaminase RidA (YjgF/YER057c/UK114 family)
MDFLTPDLGDLPVHARLARFVGADGVVEEHLILTPTQYATFDQQLDWIERAHASCASANTLVMRRLFCSDLATQLPALRARPSQPGVTSIVGQAPTPPAKVALWAYHMIDPAGLQRTDSGNTTTITRGILSHHFTTNLADTTSDTSHEQTQLLFDQYNAWLGSHGMNLADNVMRTWLFVRDIDVNYAGMVAARKTMFAANGLTPQTHFISSSGIESDPGTAARVVMDAYAIQGIHGEQVRFCHAPEHLSPTHVYGVTFERGTAVAYRDRQHVLISGTASIDKLGHIVHEGNVEKQLDRTLENIDALLRSVDARLSDMAYYLVYLRDPSDAPLIRRRMIERLGNAPMVFVTAKVCRPGWLVEIEGQAITPHQSPTLPLF